MLPSCSRYLAHQLKKAAVCNMGSDIPLFCYTSNIFLKCCANPSTVKKQHYINSHVANTASSLPELKLPSHHYSTTNCCQFHCSHFHNGSRDIQSAAFPILITTLLHIYFKTFLECDVRITTMDLNSILNLVDTRFVSQWPFRHYRSAYPPEDMGVEHGSNVIRNGFGVEMSRGACLDGITADGTVNDHIMPSHILRITQISQKSQSWLKSHETL